MRAAGDAGVVERDVEPSRFFLDPRDETGYLPLLRYIGQRRICLAAILKHHLARLGQASLAAPRTVDSCTALGEGNGSCATNARAGASDEHDSSLETGT